MCYRVIVKFATKKMYGQWTTKNQAEKDLIFWKLIIKEAADVIIESSEDIEE